MRIILTVN